MKKRNPQSIFCEVLRTAAAFCLLSALGAEAAHAEHPASMVQSPAVSPATSPVVRGQWKKRWIASWLAVAAVSTLDIYSSRGHGEANPLFRSRSGQFASGKATLVKSAIGGSFFLSQLVVIRAHPERDSYKPFALVNTAAAAGLGGIVAHNYSLPAPARATPQFSLRD